MHVIGEVDGRRCVIMDDMIDTGGTIIKALDLLKQNGAKTMHVFACHGLFSNSAMMKFAGNENNPQVYTTNTLPYEGIKNFNFFNEINIVGEFHKTLRKFDTSLSYCF